MQHHGPFTAESLRNTVRQEEKSPALGFYAACPLPPSPPSLGAGKGVRSATSALPVCELVQPHILWLSPYR